MQSKSESSSDNAVQMVGEEVTLHSGVAISQSRSDMKLTGKHDELHFENDSTMSGNDVFRSTVYPPVDAKKQLPVRCTRGFMQSLCATESNGIMFRHGEQHCDSRSKGVRASQNYRAAAQSNRSAEARQHGFAAEQAVKVAQSACSNLRGEDGPEEDDDGGAVHLYTLMQDSVRCPNIS